MLNIIPLPRNEKTGGDVAGLRQPSGNSEGKTNLLSVLFFVGCVNRN